MNKMEQKNSSGLWPNLLDFKVVIFKVVQGEVSSLKDVKFIAIIRDAKWAVQFGSKSTGTICPIKHN